MLNTPINTTDWPGVSGVAAERANPVSDITTAMRKTWNKVKNPLPSILTGGLKRFSRYS